MPPRSRPAWAWTVVILALCWIPRIYLGAIEHSPKPLFVPNFDKLVHLGIFAVFAVLWMRVGSSSRRGWWVLLAGVALAVVSELGQDLPIVNRDANLADGLADTVGVILGLLAFGLARKLLEKRAVPAEG
jgi:VanZ family protein